MMSAESIEECRELPQWCIIREIVGIVVMQELRLQSWRFGFAVGFPMPGET